MIFLSLLSLRHRCSNALRRRDILWVALPAPAQALEPLFPSDFYSKFGKRPAPIDSTDTLPGAPPFVRVQTRYDAYQKYAPKINVGLAAFKDLAQAPNQKSADTLVKTLRPMGLLANNLLATDSVTNELLLARYYINEVFFKIADVDWSRNDVSALVDQARLNLNSYLVVVNRAIPPTVGDAFPLL